jgi:hypothetical protein
LFLALFSFVGGGIGDNPKITQYSALVGGFGGPTGGLALSTSTAASNIVSA